MDDKIIFDPYFEIHPCPGGSVATAPAYHHLSIEAILFDEEQEPKWTAVTEPKLVDDDGSSPRPCYGVFGHIEGRVELITHRDTKAEAHHLLRMLGVPLP